MSISGDNSWAGDVLDGAGSSGRTRALDWRSVQARAVDRMGRSEEWKAYAVHLAARCGLKLTG